MCTMSCVCVLKNTDALHVCYYIIIHYAKIAIYSFHKEIFKKITRNMLKYTTTNLTNIQNADVYIAVFVSIIILIIIVCNVIDQKLLY